MPNAVIETAFTRHDDGFGIAWRDTDSKQVLWEKYGPGKASQDAFRIVLKRIDRDTKFEYTAHFRFATHGKACADLSHPFEYKDSDGNAVVFFHNGVLTSIRPTDGESDTSEFVKRVLTGMPTGWEANPALLALMHMAADGDRFLFMTRERTIILNENRGEWDQGLWYSSFHKPYTATTTTYQPLTPRIVTTPASETALATAMTTYNDDGEFERALRARTGSRDRRGAWSKDVETHLLPGGPSVNDEDEKDEKDNYQGYARSQEVSGSQWYHADHLIIPIEDIKLDQDRDYMEAVICNECYTVGDAYVYNGTVFIDIGHKLEGEPVEIPVKAAKAIEGSRALVPYGVH